MSAADDWDWSLRIFDHVDLHTVHYDETVRFYETVLSPLGIHKLFEEDESACLGVAPPGALADEPRAIARALDA